MNTSTSSKVASPLCTLISPPSHPLSLGPGSSLLHQSPPPDGTVMPQAQILIDFGETVLTSQKLCAHCGPTVPFGCHLGLPPAGSGHRRSCNSGCTCPQPSSWGPALSNVSQTCPQTPNALRYTESLSPTCTTTSVSCSAVTVRRLSSLGQDLGEVSGPRGQR